MIADGAAFGPEMDRVLQLLTERENYALYLPESFEWLILSSDIWTDNEIREILSTPYDYIESKDFFSWERYFTALLIEKTKGSYLAYSKKKLNTRYLNDKIKAAVLLKMEKIVLS